MNEKEYEYTCGEVKDNFLFADLHIHSKYSRACSKDLTIPNLVKWARIKGVGLLGTGDFTHPIWFEDIKQLREENGIFYYKDEKGEFPFVLSSEISLVYTQDGKGRRVHLVYLAPTISAVEKINAWLDSKGRRDYDGRPIFKISCRDFAAKMEELDERIEVIPAHIWTPWFGVFGSLGGFNSLSEAFLDKAYRIHAVETGISSDPAMNWRIKDLDNVSIVSFSDAHSFWPHRIGREATIFKSPAGEKLSYNEIIRQIREKDFIGTVETDPAYGKYHFDGHRDCNFSCSSDETRRLNGICPVCGKKLLVGVEYRVNELGKTDDSHKNKKCFYRLLPLHEIISLAIGVGVSSKGCWSIYNNLIEKFGNEFNILLNVKPEELSYLLQNNLLLELIMLNRKGLIEVRPGYDGVYGVAVIAGKEFSIEEEEKNTDEKTSDEKIVKEKKIPYDGRVEVKTKRLETLEKRRSEPYSAIEEIGISEKGKKGVQKKLF